MMEDVNLDDIQLVRISTKDLNRHLKRRGIGKNRQKEVKARRRTLKNRFVYFIYKKFKSLFLASILKPLFDLSISRGYAASCRVKRDEEEENLKQDIHNLDLQICSKVHMFDHLIHEQREIVAHLQKIGVR